MTFHPRVDQQLNIQATYSFVPHPKAKGMPFGQSGRRATVYQLRDASGQVAALKVFRPTFRSESYAHAVDRLLAFAHLPGLRVFDRTVLTPDGQAELVAQYPDLAYAVLMPWVEGMTWQEIMIAAHPLTEAQALALAQNLAHVLAAIERRGLAHCDLSGSNVIVDASEGTSTLVDVEDFFGPDLNRPERLPSGSPGYAHATAAQGLWDPHADRFGGAILLGEILGWCDEDVRRQAYGETYFEPAEVQRTSERSTLLTTALAHRWGGAVAELFTQAWSSPSMAGCPTLSAWANVLREAPIQSPSDQLRGLMQTLADTRERLTQTRLEKARLLVDVGRLDQAHHELEQVVRDAPGSAADCAIVWDAIAEAYQQRSEWAKAQAALRAAQRAAPITTRGSLVRILEPLVAIEGPVETHTAQPSDRHCPHCQTVVDAAASQCPECGRELNEPAQEGAVEPAETPSGMSNDQAGTLWLVILFAVVGFLTLVALGSPR